MKRIWLFLLAIALCCVCRAQPVRGGVDSLTGTDSLKAVDSLLPADSLKPADSSKPADSVQAGDSRMFLDFTAVLKGPDKVGLQWDADSAKDGGYFVIQRGIDGVHYETIGAVRSLAGNNHYEMTDLTPPNGVDFYRIKYENQTGRRSYSRAVELSLSGEVDFKFYPNPVDKLFIVRSAHNVDIQVLDPAGVVRLSKRLQSGIEVVDASGLEHGVYILRVTDKESNRSISTQLVKN